MLRTLFAKLALGLFLLLGTIGVLYALISVTASRHYHGMLYQELNWNLARDLVADRNLVEEGKLNERALKQTFDFYMSINPSIEIYLLDLGGKILSHSAPPDKIKRTRVSLDPIKRFLAAGEPLPILGDDPRGLDRMKAFSLTTVPSASTPEGYLYVVLRGEKYDAAEGDAWNRYVLRVGGWALIISLVTGLVAGLIILHFVTGRLHRLARVMAKFERSGFTTDLRYGPANPGPGDEIDGIGRAFDNMASEIRKQMEAHRERDALRRRLVSQISHDLRSPLAAAQGYLESLQLKKSSLSEEEKDQFLAIALRQVQWMEKLVRELLELARLEASDKLLEPEPFALDELISDVAQKHTLVAEHQAKEIYLSVGSNMPFVLGDVGAVERILDNILDNAISFSPPGGRIDIRAAVRDGHAEVEIEDNGQGISVQDLPHIFEPFFMAGGERGGSHHVGLGLAIAKRLVELQQGTIEAICKPDGKGTKMRFCLPLFCT